MFARMTYRLWTPTTIAILLPLPRVLRYSIIYGLQVYGFMILVWAVLSWIDHSRGFLRDLYNLLDVLVLPFISIFRRFVPVVGGVDFSPVVAMIILQLLTRWL